MEEQLNNMWNMSLATLQRIDNLLRSLTNYYITGQLILIQISLKCLYKEVYPFLDAKERIEGNNMLKEIDTKGFQKFKGQESFSYNADLFIIMHSFEFWIRNKLHEKGLLMAKGEDIYNVL